MTISKGDRVRIKGGATGTVISDVTFYSNRARKVPQVMIRHDVPVNGETDWRVLLRNLTVLPA